MGATGDKVKGKMFTLSCVPLKYFVTHLES
jgi:hypothetical protein